MIDPHVHLRDWGEAAKESLVHGIHVARETGIDAVFDMPNTDPPLTTPETVKRRLSEAEAIINTLDGPFHYGLFCGATADTVQLEHMVELYHGERLGRNGRAAGIVGIKMYAGPSTGTLAASAKEAQQLVYTALTELGYGGVICVHCEKESLFLHRPDGGLDWDPEHPRTFAHARPPESEVESVRDQIDAAEAAGFGGTLHIAHVTVPETVRLIESARERVRFRISCEATPHHLLFSESALDEPDGMLFKTNPPLRPEVMRAELYAQLCDGRINFVASDHAPHTLEDKLERHASGMPGLGVMHYLRERLAREGTDERLLSRLFHRGAEEVYGVELPAQASVIRPQAQLDYPTNTYVLDEI
ncbi:MAG: dihydroorotase [Spirochaetaceae bacterium]